MRAVLPLTASRNILNKCHNKPHGDHTADKQALNQHTTLHTNRITRFRHLLSGSGASFNSSKYPLL